jgi:hypothetical protein
MLRLHVFSKSGTHEWRDTAERRLLISSHDSFDARITMTNQLHMLSRPTAPFIAMSSGDESDDLDDLLDETGEVTNRSNGKTGTDTTAEPDHDKPQPSSAAQPDHIEQQPVPGHTENIPANPAEPAPRGPNEDRAPDARPDTKPGTPPGTQSERDRNKSPD